MSIQNLSDYSPDSSYSLCSLDGVKRNQSSAYYVVTLSTSVIIAFLSPVAVAGNSLVLAAIWRDQSLRTPSYILLFGLALTDLCTGLISQPSHIAVRVLCFNELQLVKKEETFLLYTKALGESCGTYFGSLTVIFITFMSIERWLHMTRRSLLTVRRSCYIVAVSSLLLIPVVVFRLLHVFKKTTGLVSNLSLFILLLLCLVTTPISYFNVFRIIHRHQEQIHANGSSQNFGQPACNLAKYKKTVVFILYILGVFYISFLPFLVFVGLSFRYQYCELEILFHISLLFLFLSSSINPLIYLWRISDIRNGVKQLLEKLLPVSQPVAS